MIEAFVLTSDLCKRIRSGPAGRYIDSFAEHLRCSGYRSRVGLNLLYVAKHFTGWAQNEGITIAALGELVLERFQQHLPSCRCVRPNGGKGRIAKNGSRLFLNFLVRFGVVPGEQEEAPRFPPLVASFRHWMVQHRGISEVTLSFYSERVVALLTEFGEDPGCFHAQDLRHFVLNYAREHKIVSTKYTVTAIRMFLRYLATEGRCAAGLEHAIPTFANWRLSTIPRYWPASDVEQVVDVCDDSTEVGARDRAIMLLLWRLGLRSGDILGLRLSDIDWAKGSLLVSGKSARESDLPLTQEVGDALLTYLRCRTAVDTDKVFVRVIAPIRPLKGPQSVASIVRRALQSAGVEAPTQGAHLLRHSAATEMLRQGVSLQDIQTVLRHRSIETTTIYAKVDVRLLKQIAQPWPEVSSC